MLKGEFVILDLETTGTSFTNDEIIEIGAVKWNGNAIIDRFQVLIKPNIPIPTFVQKLTGITDEMVAGAPSFEEIIPEFLAFVKGAWLVAHHAEFDMGFLKAKLGPFWEHPPIDTVELAKMVFPAAPDYRLSTLTQCFGITNESSHRALSDAQATAELFTALISKLECWESTTLLKVARWGEKVAWPLTPFINQMAVFLASRFPLSARGDEIYRPRIKDGLWYQDEGLVPQPGIFNYYDLRNILAPGGLFSADTTFEHREQQVEMLLEVARTLHDEGLLVVEAATGTGKSLAYLIPSIYWAIDQGKRVVISTHTIQLQEQLWSKDLPMLSRRLGVKFAAALVKGRNNYLCRRKWEQVLREDEWGLVEGRLFLRILGWAKETMTGDRNEINLTGHEEEKWFLVSADSESCLGVKCSWFRSGCYAMEARREAENSHLLIVNHSLLLTDAKMENKILPSYDYLIIDEAHQLEDGVTEHLSWSLSQRGLNKLLSSLFKGSKDNSTGFLNVIKSRLTKRKIFYHAQDQERVEELLKEAIDLIIQVREKGNEFFTLIQQLICSDRGWEDNQNTTFRLRPEYKTTTQWWPPFLVAQSNLSLYLKELSDKLLALTQKLGNLEDDDEWIGEIRDIQSLALICRELGIGLEKSLQFETNQVSWLEGKNGKEWSDYYIKQAPIRVGDLLRDLLFAKKKAVVLTSATISVSGDFSSFLTQSGLDTIPSERLVTKEFKSPFSYDKQTLLFIAQDLPNPAILDDQGYSAAIAPALIEFIEAAQGRTLILFTSHRMLRETYRLIKSDLEIRDIKVLGHNIDGGRTRLIEEFQICTQGVLLGAGSFWEGVDIPGQALSSVIIVKLPFLPPNTPVVEARLEDLARQNKDGFRHYSIPKAVIRFKQGFGRLIRSYKDYGAVIIMDRRIIEKSYGRYFLRSLPVRNHIRGNKNLIRTQLQGWLTRERDPVSMK